MELEYWAKERWWLSEEYERVCAHHSITHQEVDDRFDRVMEVFSPEWQHTTPPHPVLYVLLTKGLLPLQFLFSLGGNLRSAAECLRFKHVVQDLRLPDTYESARLELQIASYLKDKGHGIEFRPPLNSGKQSDFVAARSEQKAFFEIKRMQPSRQQRAMDALGQEVGLAASDLGTDPRYPQLTGKWFRIEIDPYVAELLSGEPEADRVTIRTVVTSIVNEISTRAEKEQEFELPSLANVTVVPERTESGANWPASSCQNELKRFLRAHLQKAIGQLPPEHPGLVVAQMPGQLDKVLTTRIIKSWLRECDATHVTAIVFLPVYNPMPMTWALFNPFAVVNDQARSQADQVQAFVDLAPLITAQVAIPTA